MFGKRAASIILLSFYIWRMEKLCGLKRLHGISSGLGMGYSASTPDSISDFQTESIDECQDGCIRNIWGIISKYRVLDTIPLEIPTQHVWGERQDGGSQEPIFFTSIPDNSNALPIWGTNTKDQMTTTLPSFPIQGMSLTEKPF